MSVIAHEILCRRNRSENAYELAKALDGALAGDIVRLGPGTFDLDSGIVVPEGVHVVGEGPAITQIQMLNVVADTVLMTLGAGSRIDNLGLKLTSVGHYTLTGVLWADLVGTAKLRNATVEVDNSGASSGGSSNVYGVRVQTSATPDRTKTAIRATTITAHSIGSGTKRSIVLDTLAGNIHLRDVNLRCFGSGAGSYIAAESNILGGRLTHDSGLSDGDTADVSETAGTLELGAVQLLHSHANGKGFHNTRYSLPFVWGDPGSLVGASTRFMRPGSATSAIAEIKHRLARAACVKTLHIRAQAGPGASRTDTWTIRKNGADTLLTGSLTGAETFKLVDTISVDFADGDDISCKVVTAAGTAISDVVVGVELF